MIRERMRNQTISTVKVDDSSDDSSDDEPVTVGSHIAQRLRVDIAELQSTVQKLAERLDKLESKSA